MLRPDEPRSPAPLGATSVGDRSDNADETARAAESARTVANQGAGAIAEAPMQAVQASSSEVTSVIRDLGAESDQIGDIVATITGISEQTNLLALNAAIEAARRRAGARVRRGR